MEQILDKVNSVLTGNIMIWGVLLVGVILSIKTGFVQITKLAYTIKSVISEMISKKKSDSGITPFQAVATALSGTLGTGNIVGVAAAITIGGSGAIFWMWISAFFGMATKYSEILLSIKYRTRDEAGRYVGGPMYYLNYAVKNKSLSIIFAFLCLLSSFGIGNMVQANAISDAIRSIAPNGYDFRPIIILIAVLIAVVIIGGIKRIASVTEAFTPIMAVFYLLGCFIVIGRNIHLVPAVFSEIISDALNIKGAVGGVCGFTVAQAMKTGFSRGIFTNEAGLGSAPIAHAAAEAKSPADQGLLGIFEVFFDTIFMCTLTGTVIILSGFHNTTSLDGAVLTFAAFQKYLGEYAGIFLAASTILFAVASIIGWSYYGQTCVKYLFKSKTAIIIYKLLYIIAIYVGSTITLRMVWGIADLFNGLMMIPNLIGVVLLADVVKEETVWLKSCKSSRKVRR